MEPGCEVRFGAVLKFTRAAASLKFVDSTLHSFRYEAVPRYRNRFPASFREKVVDAPAHDLVPWQSQEVGCCLVHIDQAAAVVRYQDHVEGRRSRLA